MAIEKTIFGDGTGATYKQLLEWMQANASDYFYSIDKRANYDDVQCKIDENTVCASLGVATSISFATKNGGVITSNTAQKCLYAIKTSKGVYLKYNDNMDVFIVNTDKNTTAVVALMTISGGYVHLYYGDLVNSSSFQDYAYSASFNNGDGNTKVLAMASQQADLTTFAPIVFPSGSIATGLYVMPQNQYSGLACNITTKDGTTYFSNGAFALKE